MTNTFHEGDQGGQFLADQAAVSDVRRQRSDRLAALRTPVFGKSVLFNGQRRFLDVHLLHDAGKVSIAMHGAAAAGTDFESVLLEVSDLFGREGLAFVLGVAGLAADGTLGPVLKGGLGLDDVRGRGLGGRGGILAGSGKVFAQRVSSEETESNLACSAFTCACSRRQFGQGFLAAVSIAAVLWVLPTTGCVGKEKARAYAVNAYPFSMPICSAKLTYFIPCSAASVTIGQELFAQPGE